MLPILDVYIASIDDAQCPIDDIRCAGRREELLLPQAESVRRSRIADWHLLEMGLERLGLDVPALSFTAEASGRRRCSAACFSLTHTDRYAACAVSDLPVGIDAEETDRFEDRFDAARRHRLKERIACPAENDIDLLPLWLAKESAFKASDLDAFDPAHIDTSASPIRYIDLRPAVPLMLAVCGERYDMLRVWMYDGKALRQIECLNMHKGKQ